jgi:hypothetical protein
MRTTTVCSLAVPTLVLVYMVVLFLMRPLVPRMFPRGWPVRCHAVMFLCVSYWLFCSSVLQANDGAHNGCCGNSNPVWCSHSHSQSCAQQWSIWRPQWNSVRTVTATTTQTTANFKGFLLQGWLAMDVPVVQLGTLVYATLGFVRYLSNALVLGSSGHRDDVESAHLSLS